MASRMVLRRSEFPLADMTSGLYACNAIMFALYHRANNGGAGQVIDVSLFESLFSLLGPLPAEFAALGRERTRDGSRSKNAGPRGCYRTRDDRWIAVSGSTPKMAERFLRSYGLDVLLMDPRFAPTRPRAARSISTRWSRKPSPRARSMRTPRSSRQIT